MLGRRIEVRNIFRGPEGLTRIAPDGLTEGLTPLVASLAAVVNRKGVIEDLGIVCRMKVSTAFVALLCKSMVPANTAEYALWRTFKYHTWGTGTTYEANTQYALVTPAASYQTDASATLDTGTQVAAAAAYSSVCTMTAIGSINVTEHCIHPTADWPGIANGLDRSVFPAIPLTASDTITWTYTLNTPAET